MVDAVNAINNTNNGNFDANQSSGDTSGMTSFRNTAASIFRGIGSISNSFGDSLMQAGAIVGGMQGPSMYTNSLRMLYNGGWGWGWGPGIGIWGYPMYFGPLGGIFGDPMMALGGAPTGGCRCNCGGAAGGASGAGGIGATVPINNNAQSPSVVASQIMDVSGLGLNNINPGPPLFVPINNPSSVSEAFTLIDRANHPNRYNADGTAKTSKDISRDPKNKPMELMDPKTGKSRSPVWYRQIANKVEQNKELTDAEKELYQRYNELFRTYSPYQLDENLDMILDSNGQPVETTLNNELLQLQHWIDGKCREDIEAYINSCSPEKLAALELHYPMLEFSGGKSLRDAVKDATIASWCEWSGWNTDRCQRIFDKMDEAAMMSPTNMKNALYQALENHRMGGFGFDEQRLNKLLSQMQGNKVFRDYVKMEYPGLINDIRKKWFKSDETEDLLRRIFN
ncbi:MAG: hypothetical protein K6A44_02950 [bacterium]|nr:hypothetical protein [bacterium]